MLRFSAAAVEAAAPQVAPSLAVVPAESGAVSGWDGEPETITELESRYEVIAMIPARNPTCQLRVVKVEPKDGSDPQHIVDGQNYKLFIALCLM